jgi:MraZ protein
VLFTGHSEHSVDAKLRLAIPARYRNLWDPVRDGSAWYSVPSTGLIRLYTERTFEKLADQGESTLTPDDETAKLEEALFGLAERLEMDSAGRVMLPRWQWEQSGLPSDVVIVGARYKLEIHDAKLWLASRADKIKSLPSLIAKRDPRES